MASTGLLRPHQSRIALLQRAVDAAIILGTLYGATYLPRVNFDQEAVRDAYVMAGLLAVVTYTFVAEMSRLYASWRGSTVVAEVIRAQWCWVIVSERWPNFRRFMIRGGRHRWAALSVAVSALAAGHSRGAASPDSEIGRLLAADPILAEYLKLHADGFERDADGILWLENLLLASGL